MPEKDICAIYKLNMQELKKLPEKYHCWKHTKYGLDILPCIARQEKLSEEDVSILEIAYLYHERGMVFGREGHEIASVVIMREELPGFGFLEEEIIPMEPLVLSTKMPQKPQNKREMVMCDTDMCAIGSRYFPYVSELLRSELGASQKDWPIVQIEFLKNHKYYTDAAKTFFEQQKQKNLQRLLKNAEEQGYDISKYLL